MCLLLAFAFYEEILLGAHVLLLVVLLLGVHVLIVVASLLVAPVFFLLEVQPLLLLLVLVKGVVSTLL